MQQVPETLALGSVTLHPLWDGHTHTERCPHGSKEPTEQFIERAIKLGFRRYSLTEHYPLPPGMIDPTPEQDCALAAEDLEGYLEHAFTLKERYRDRIEILVGFEFDYLPAYVDWTREQITHLGDRLEDSLLSVHFLGETIIDSTPEALTEGLLDAEGSIAGIYRRYYQTLIDAVQADLGPRGPRRLGHLNVIRKFVQRIPPEETEGFDDLIGDLLDALEERGWALDYNVAGLKKPLCGEVYVPDPLVERMVAEGRRIDLVYGSDTHSVKGVGQKYDVYAGIPERIALDDTPPTP